MQAKWSRDAYNCRIRMVKTYSMMRLLQKFDWNSKLNATMRHLMMLNFWFNNFLFFLVFNLHRQNVLLVIIVLKFIRCKVNSILDFILYLQSMLLSCYCATLDNTNYFISNMSIIIECFFDFYTEIIYVSVACHSDFLKIDIMSSKKKSSHWSC